MAALVVSNSPLRFAELVTADGVTFWDVVDLPTIVSQPDDLTYQVMSPDRIDTIASKFYGDPVLWWVVALANDMELLPDALYAGQILRIPSPRYVLQELFLKAKVR